MDKFCVFASITNEGRESKNKGFSVYYASQFPELCSVGKSAHYTRLIRYMKKMADDAFFLFNNYY